jgi:hypothetical protein
VKIKEREERGEGLTIGLTDERNWRKENWEKRVGYKCSQGISGKEKRNDFPCCVLWAIH